MKSTALIRRDSAVLLLVDHQVGLLSGVRDITTTELSHNVAALAKAARILGVPVLVTTVGPGNMWGPLLPELQAALPGVQPITRTAVNAWDHPAVVAAVKATGRTHVLVAGISTETCAGLPALSAHEAGYRVSVVLDASGTFNEAKRQSALQRMTVAGVQFVDYATAAVEMLGDNADPKAGEVYGAIDMSFAGIVQGLMASVRNERPS